MKTFSRDKAIDILKNQPGVKISHVYFDDDEYIYGEDGVVKVVKDENGYLFDDWNEGDIFHYAGMRNRVGGRWETDWFYYEEEK